MLFYVVYFLEILLPATFFEKSSHNLLDTNFKISKKFTTSNYYITQNYVAAERKNIPKRQKSIPFI